MKEISDVSTSVMWRNVKLIDMWRNFIFLHICHVQIFSSRAPPAVPATNIRYDWTLC